MIRLTLDGKPPRKNDKHKVFASKRVGGGVGRKRSARYIDTCDRVRLAWLASRQEPALSGQWALRMHVYWSTLRHLNDIDVPNGDIDAPIESVLDALQRAGAVDDDARVVHMETTKYYDKLHPRVEILLMELTT